MTDSEYKRIALLIAKEVNGEISEEELKILGEWRRRDDNNEALYCELLNSQKFKTWLAARNLVDIEEGWANIIPKIRKESRIKSIKKVMRIAASFLIPLLIGGMAYFYISNQISSKKINQQKYVQIRPGSSKATLILGDGRSMILDSIGAVSLTEIDGTQIQKKEGEISYQKKEETKGKSQVYNTINVPLGGEYKLTLADGTKVYLNSMTTLKYPVQFGPDNREVELSGEAYFEVVENKAKPFVVNTKEMKVEVLGTSFNVNAFEDSQNTVTTLVEGKVKLTHSLNSEYEQILNPNEQAILDNLTGKIALRTVDVNNFTSWKDGQLVFYDMPLESIMILLTRWYSAKVFYLNPEVKSIRFSGSLDKYDEIGKFIDIIDATHQVEVKIKDDTILFTKK